MLLSSLELHNSLTELHFCRNLKWWWGKKLSVSSWGASRQQDCKWQQHRLVRKAWLDVYRVLQFLWLIKSVMLNWISVSHLAKLDKSLWSWLRLHSPSTQTTSMMGWFSLPAHSELTASCSVLLLLHDTAPSTRDLTSLFPVDLGLFL